MSIGQEHKFDEMDRLVGGQPRWYWCLPFFRRNEIHAERAAKAGNVYVRDASKDGLNKDGSVNEEYMRSSVRRRSLVVGKKMKENIERRSKEL